MYEDWVMNPYLEGMQAVLVGNKFGQDSEYYIDICKAFMILFRTGIDLRTAEIKSRVI